VAEVARLISDPALPLWRRVAYAGLFLAGPRPGELFVRRWNDLDESWTPLPLLRAFTGWSSKLWKEGPTKTGARKYLPVHPAWRALLSEWRAEGCSPCGARWAGLVTSAALPGQRQTARELPAGRAWLLVATPTADGGSTCTGRERAGGAAGRGKERTGQSEGGGYLSLEERTATGSVVPLRRQGQMQRASGSTRSVDSDPRRPAASQNRYERPG
jgi:hypothetical protein